MAASDRAVAIATLFSNVSYELNDLRPMARPSSVPDTTVAMCDLFFLVNEYVDGVDAMLLHDMSKFEEAYAEVLLEDWLRVLEELLTADGLEGGLGAFGPVAS